MPLIRSGSPARHRAARATHNRQRPGAAVRTAGRTILPGEHDRRSSVTSRDPGEADELRRRLQAALTRLTDRQRSVIVLHDIEGFTHGEIAGMLEIPEGTARSDLHHARTTLRRLLHDVRSDS